MRKFDSPTTRGVNGSGGQHGSSIATWWIDCRRRICEFWPAGRNVVNCTYKALSIRFRYPCHQKKN
ncbi:hypothetical protein LINGRAHAP2_LOCUS12539 [Linum grandiflorum]